jgi:pSer/pThr/pTyr-binding forkhead associated (FHA) protein
VELASVGTPESRFVLTELPLIIGTSPAADLRLDDPAANAYHCMIDQVNGTLVVSDLVSQAGTWLNGRRVEESPLLPGDELTVGMTSLVVRYAREADRQFTA